MKPEEVDAQFFAMVEGAETSIAAVEDRWARVETARRRVEENRPEFRKSLLRLEAMVNYLRDLHGLPPFQRPAGAEGQQEG